VALKQRFEFREQAKGRDIFPALFLLNFIGKPTRADHASLTTL
jgi:hypothetical protein